MHLPKRNKMEMLENGISYTFRIEKEVLIKLKQIAEIRETTVSAIIRSLMRHVIAVYDVADHDRNIRNDSFRRFIEREHLREEAGGRSFSHHSKIDDH